MKADIPALTGLRGIAALWVFAFHATYNFRDTGHGTNEVISLIGASGFLGVDLFFVLSGFVLALNYASAGTHRSLSSYGGFLWKRIARIYPVHLAALALLAVLLAAFAAFDSAFLPPRYLTWSGLLQSLTLTHAWSIPIAKTWNSVSWSISCEWAAYLAFPLIALAANRVRLGLGVFALIIGLFALLAFFILDSVYPNAMAYGMPRIAVEFSAGVLLYRLWELQGSVKGMRGDVIAFAALIILIVGGNLLAIRVNAYVALVYMPLLACAVVYGLASGAGFLSRALSTRAAQWCGHVSYAFYMVHGMMLNLANRIVGTFELTASTAWVVTAVLVALIASAAVAAGIYYWIETPARRAMVNWSGRFPGADSRRLPALD